MSGASAAATDAAMCSVVARMSGRRRADLVAPGADDELAEAEADHGAGERELDGRGRDAELVLQHGERRQVQVDREGAERRERAEDEHVDEALPTREEVAGVRDGRVVVGPDDGDGGG